MSDERADQSNYTDDQHDAQRWKDEVQNSHDALKAQIVTAEETVKQLKAQLKDNDERVKSTLESPHQSGVSPEREEDDQDNPDYDHEDDEDPYPNTGRE